MICSFPIRPASIFFFFNDTATTEIYTLSLHDALPISIATLVWCCGGRMAITGTRRLSMGQRSQHRTSELQSHLNLVCRLILQKKKRLTTSVADQQTRP